VSNLGRVRRDLGGTGNAKAGRILATSPDRKGYRRVSLMTDGVRDTRRVHQLVAAAFIGPCPPDHEVGHKNNDKADNRADNLEYCTDLENARKAAADGLLRPARGEKNAGAQLTEPEALAILQEFVTTPATTAEIAQARGLGYMLVHRLVTGETWPHLPVDREALSAAVARKRHADKRRAKKVTLELAALLREEYAGGTTTYAALGEAHGLCWETVYRVVSGKGRYGQQ
jgi:hypothetical protein